MIDEKIYSFNTLNVDYYPILDRKSKAVQSGNNPKTNENNKPYKDPKNKFNRDNFKKLDPNVQRIQAEAQKAVELLKKA